MKYTVAIGDIHGCLQQLIELRKHLEERRAPGDEYKFVFLGDYIDRGPDSKGVLDFLIKMYHEGGHIFLRGNHDNFALNRGFSYSDWMRNGGGETLQSYPEGKMQEKHLGFLANAAQLYYMDMNEKRIFVHAGINRKYPMSLQNEFTLTWIREEFLNSKQEDDRYVVHGHTPMSKRAQILDNRCNLDTGCVFDGVLTAGVFNDTQLKPLYCINHLGVIYVT